MTLLELSKDYRASAAALKARIQELEAAYDPHMTRDDYIRLDERIRVLSAMWRESRDIAVLCEHYYERGYRRNAKYTI